MLQSELFYIFVLGPGLGESVLIRIPPNRWIVVDSFKCVQKPAVQYFLQHYNATLDAIVLTHPHADHYPGILELIDAYPDAALGCVHPHDAQASPGVSNNPDLALGQRAKPTYDRIWTEWHNNPTRRWDLYRGDVRRVADATIVSLHPPRPTALPAWSRDPNEISSALRLHWFELTIVLGGDVPNSQWPAIGNAFNDLGRHALLKVPHHGSIGAMHDSFGRGTRDRTWIVTPFARSGGLPRADDGHGLEAGLTYVSHVHLTALAHRHDDERAQPCNATRGQLLDGTHPRKNNRQTMHSLLASEEALERHVIAAFDKSGRLRLLTHGAGSIRVT